MKDAVKDRPKPVRWWPLILVLVVTALGLAATWLREWNHHQDQVTQTLGIVVVAFCGFAAWFFFFSRLPARTRRRSAVVLALATGAFLLLFRVHGVSGNLVPILELRFGKGQKLAASSHLAEVEISTSEQDFPQFRGVSRDGVVRGIALDRDWAGRPPRELWRRPVGAGWSGFAVVGQLAMTQEQREGQEVVAAYQMGTGEPSWSHVAVGAFINPVGGDGPRATPTVGGGQVFTFGPTGLLRAFELSSGKLLWSHQAAEENGGKTPSWGYAGSPLLVGELVVVSVGGKGGNSLVAYRRSDGEKVWSGGDDSSGYSSTMLATLAGRRQIVIFNQSSVAAHDPQNGKLLWSYPWPANQPNVAQPVVLGENRLLVSSGYGIGSTLLEINSSGEGLVAKELWHSNQMKVKFSNLVQKGGKLYGLDDGILACLDAETGQRCWKKGRYGHGQILLVGDLLLLLSEGGDVVLIEPNAEELKELGRFPALIGKTWNTFALAGSKLLVRNDQEAACFELPLAEG